MIAIWIIGWKELIKNYMTKVGQIGKGSFGKKILSKLNNISNISIEWVCGSQDKWWKQEKVDWVIVASPNEFHYEQVKYFLENNTNVFCEKPGTLCSNSLKELIKISKNNNLHFYIDDVLIYENILPQNDFVYKKWGGSSDNIIDRMAYHHFYLIYNKCKNYKLSDFKINIIKNEKTHKSFELGVKHDTYKFEYDFGWHKPKTHNISPQYNEDALEKMLTHILLGKADFTLNTQRSLFATEISEYVKKELYGKCSVVGAGIYGITAAIKLKTKGFEVDLFEAEDDILKAASGINQYRIHRGYHYPRSLDTIKSCKDNEPSFIKYYNRSIIRKNDHYYSIAKEDSLVSPEQYLVTLDKMGLEWKITETTPNCDLTIQVNEKLYDPKVLKNICYNRIKGNGINLILNNRIKNQLTGYKYNIHSTYSSLNDLTQKKQDYQFELCEKPLFKLPKQYKNKSIVIMDGPFMCFDPYSDTEYHLGGNVVHAIHIRNIGEKPEIPSVYKKYLNKGIIKNPKYTNVDRFIESSKKFFPEIEQSKHLGSMYTIRTVLPNMDNTDERPTIVDKQGNNITLFSGKIGNCVEAANKIEEIINEN
tara:strand:+ start:4827 stop:6599 length:1773 start_codon:yes stop_codon:yes gene_type:complete